MAKLNETNTLPLFGPMVSIGKLLAGQAVTDQEFVDDESDWVIAYIKPSSVDKLGDLEPMTPDQIEVVKELVEDLKE